MINALNRFNPTNNLIDRPHRPQPHPPIRISDRSDFGDRYPHLDPDQWHHRIDASVDGLGRSPLLPARSPVRFATVTPS
ncbi:hypothetical protein AB3R30_24080 [Leptolyngbyaceae cyanobacterium UHCC 1019]